MLCLSRKRYEEIILDHPKLGQIVVTVSKIVGARVTLGIVAPPEVNIRRGELKPPLVEVGEK